jgi:hypothetical protein
VAENNKNSTAAPVITAGFSFDFEQRKTGEKQTQDQLFGARPPSGSGGYSKISRNGRAYMDLLCPPSNFA